MIRPGQVWFTGERSVEVLATDSRDVIVRDAYGRRRTLTEQDFTRGFVSARDAHPATPVMACRSLADLEPA